jgi:hypothetical protein
MTNLVIYSRGPGLLGFLAGGMALLAVGCGGGRKPVYPVEGQVFVDGKAAARAVVTFHPVGDTGTTAVLPVGHADETGKFTLTSYRENDGAPEGEYDVTVTWHLATRTPGRSEDYVPKNYLPARYASPETAKLRVTVSRDGPNTLEPFQLHTR